MYFCYLFVVECAGLLVDRYLPGWYLHFVLFVIVADFIIYFYVLAEVGKHLLRFNRIDASYWQVAFLLFVLAVAGIGALTKWAVFPHHSLLSDIYVVTMRATEVLAFAGFLALIGWSSLRKLSWPDRELHIATGFGFRSLAWFVVCLLHTQWSDGEAYHRLDLAGQIAELIVLAYWLHYFWVGTCGEASAQATKAGIGNGQDHRNTDRPQRLGIAGAMRSAVENAEPY